MSDPAIWFDHYDWPGGREAMLRVGVGDAPVVLIAPALFEEANRTRACTVSIMRALATHGLASALPDLPGQGESLMPTEQATLAGWRAAFAAAAALTKPTCVASIRGGALVDAVAAPPARWRLSPMDGATMARELTRLAALSGADGLVAGNRIAPTLIAELAGATLATDKARTVRLDGDPRPADHVVAARPLWRTAEPDNDPDLATRLAGDIAAWTTRCDSF